MIYHQPVLLEESVDGLNIRPDENKIYVDVTYGGGGHSEEILKRMGRSRLIAFDQDKDAEQNAEKINDERFLFLNQSFRFLKNNLRYYKAMPVSGIIADLGVSWYQFDTAERGFSFRFDALLDMRMNRGRSLTAREIINKYPVGKLKEIFHDFGEIKNAGQLASVIEKNREVRAISTVNELKEAIGNCIDKRKESQYLAQVFQALRIEVNDEISSLKTFLTQALDVLEKGGRLVVIAYHSLEDRIVKNYIRTGNFEGEMVKDFFGNIQKPFSAVINKVIVPSEEEIKNNPRARSAKLRIAEKI